MAIFRLIPSNIKDICLIVSTFSLFYLLSHPLTSPIPAVNTVISVVQPPPTTVTATTIRHLLFSIASSQKSYANRKPYIRLWYNPYSTNAVVFLDRPVKGDDSVAVEESDLPPVMISGDTSRFPYTFPKGLRSAIRVARIVKEVIESHDSDDIKWYVFGDDDTVFVTENLVRVLNNYDPDKWIYIGSNSESYEQNYRHSFNMAFGGGGFAISSRSLGRVLVRVLDSCLMRYPHVYGSDSRVYSCLVELGVELTNVPGFHQVDIRGNLFGILAAHPLSPLLSLHHFDIIDPIFPGYTKLEAVKHLFKAIKHDPARILQQTVCYDSSNSITVSVSWGYAVQVFEGNRLLPDLIEVQKTFSSWRRKENFLSSLHMFNTRDYSNALCKSPEVFFFEDVFPDDKKSYTLYKRKMLTNCSRSNAIRNLINVKVFSEKVDADADADAETKQMTALRRQCCEILRPYNETMIIALRSCETDELIAMNP